MRKFTISLPTPSDLGKAARSTKTAVSSKVHSDARLAKRVEKLATKLDKAVTDFKATYKAESTCVDISTPAAVVPQLVSLGSNVSA
jgi:hypothetical protein